MSKLRIEAASDREILHDPALAEVLYGLFDTNGKHVGDEIVQRIIDSNIHILNVIGQPASGKTTLILQIERMLRERMNMSIFKISFDEVRQTLLNAESQVDTITWSTKRW